MRPASLLGILIIALFVLPAAPVRAADKPKDEHAAKADGHDKGGHGKGDHKDENLNPFKGSVDLGLFTIIVFAILFTILSLFAWPQIREGLDKRERSIAADKHEAEVAKKEASALKATLEAEKAKANAEIKAMIDKARADAAATAAEEIARGKAELTAERERLNRELKISTDDALSRIWEEAANLASVISTKAVRKQLSPDDHRSLVAEALNEFKASAAGRVTEMKEARG